MKQYLRTLCFFVFAILVLPLSAHAADFGGDAPVLQDITKEGIRTFTVENIAIDVSTDLNIVFYYSVDGGEAQAATISGYYMSTVPEVNLVNPPLGYDGFKFTNNSFRAPYIIDEGPDDLTVEWDALSDLGAGTYENVTFLYILLDGDANTFNIAGEAFDLDLDAPFAPTTFTVEYEESEFANCVNVVVWGDYSETGKYVIYRDGDLTHRLTNTTYCDTAVTPGETYTYSAGRIDAALNESELVTKEFTVSDDAELEDLRPPYPTEFEGEATSDASIELSWNAMPDTDEYFFVYDADTMVVLYEGADASFTHNGLTPDTAYSYVIAKYQSGYPESYLSPLSPEITILTDTGDAVMATAEAPTGVTLTVLGEDSIRVDWETLPLLAYNLYNGDGDIIKEGLSVGTYTHEGLDADTTYAYKLKADDGTLSSFSATKSATTKEAESSGSGSGSSSASSDDEPEDTTEEDTDEDILPADLPADCPALEPGDLWMVPSAGTAVYYFGADGKSRWFANGNVFYTWYENFASVSIERLSAACGEYYDISAYGLYLRPGAFLVKNPIQNTVYVVTPRGILRAIPSEAVAKRLYGDDWNTKVVDIFPFYWPSFIIGDPLSEDAESHDGQFVEIDGQNYVQIDGELQELDRIPNVRGNRINRRGDGHFRRVPRGIRRILMSQSVNIDFYGPLR